MNLSIYVLIFKKVPSYRRPMSSSADFYFIASHFEKLFLPNYLIFEKRKRA